MERENGKFVQKAPSTKGESVMSKQGEMYDDDGAYNNGETKRRKKEIRMLIVTFRLWGCAIQNGQMLVLMLLVRNWVKIYGMVV